MKDLVIGVLGGMGTYATINLFKQYAKIFPAEKEWERPRIIIDNRCTMPSRVRAFLYHEKSERLIDEMTDSIEGLLKMGGGKTTRIILACNTSHLFLPQIFERFPEAERAVVSIIDSCVERIAADGVKRVYLLGTEGTLESQVYQTALAHSGILCDAPERKQYEMLRKCIESVKQDKYSEDVRESFIKLMSESDMPYILGCTELPILYEKYHKDICTKIYDPLQITLEKLKGEYDCD